MLVNSGSTAGARIGSDCRANAGERDPQTNRLITKLRPTLSVGLGPFFDTAGGGRLGLGLGPAAGESLDDLAIDVLYLDVRGCVAQLKAAQEQQLLFPNMSCQHGYTRLHVLSRHWTQVWK